MKANNSVAKARFSRRQIRGLVLGLSFCLNGLLLTGCNQQDAAAAAQVILPAVSALSGANTSTSTTPSTNTQIASKTSSSSSPLTSLGATSKDASSGLGSGDSSTTIPSYGANASKAQINEMLEAASAKYGIPADILKGVAYQESGWRVDAKSFDGQHGKGIMQIDDRFHAFARTADVWDPAKNIDYGAKFLRDLYDETGSWESALKRYNGSSSYPPLIMAHANNKPWTTWVAA
jgi:soluble lytic murein transglycosylase-like protein